MGYILQLDFSHEINTSLQIGDNVYFTSTSSLAGFDYNNSTFGGQTHVGVVYAIITPFQIEVEGDYLYSNGQPNANNIPSDSDYISFSKNRIANNNDLLGYFATAEFVNDSPWHAFLWSVGSDVTENSK
jgi:hypothetical protein